MKKIVVFRNDRLGEFLLNIPALRALKETFNARITLIVNEYLKNLSGCIEYIDDVLCWNNKKHSFADIRRFARRLRLEKFDAAVVLNPTKEAHIISYLAKIPVRCGYDRKFGFLLNRKIRDEKFKADMHEVEYNLKLVGLIGAETKDKSLALKIPDTAGSKLLPKSEYAVVHPFTSYSWKQWPLENFYQLIKRIKDKVEVVLIGGTEEVGRGKYFDDLGIVNLVGKTNLIQLAAVLKGAGYLISNDSGPVHLGCCVNTPCIVLFNKSRVELSAKRWGPWGENHIVVEKNSLEDISVDEVLEKIDF